MNNKEFIFKIDESFNECLEIIKNKSLDYSTKDDPFKTLKASILIDVIPEKAILIRVIEKIGRISTILDNEKINIKDEKLNDTLNDIINYISILKIFVNYEGTKIKKKMYKFQKNHIKMMQDLMFIH